MKNPPIRADYLLGPATRCPQSSRLPGFRKSGQECVALSTFIGWYKRRRWSVSFTAGGNTYPEATTAAMNSCNSDERSQGRCQYRVAACAGGLGALAGWRRRGLQALKPGSIARFQRVPTRLDA
jgi:hypothetical protein